MALEIVRSSTKARVLASVVTVALAVVLVRLPFAFGEYRVYQFTLVIIWAIAVMGLNLLVGYNGQISIGHNAFFAVGAYTAAILMDRYEANFVLCLLAAGAVSFVVGVAVGIPALRLHGLHLAIVTLALAVGTTAVLQRFDGLTGGASGLGVPKLRAPDWTGLADDQYLYFVALLVGLVMFVIARNMVRSGFGRAMVAVKDNPLAAEAMGVDGRVFKVLTFAVSGMFAGVGGVLYAVTLAYISPEAFPLLLSVTFLAAVAVGGLGTVTGAVVGAIFVQYVPQWASEINDSLATLIYGVILIVVMIAMPDGIVGRVHRLIRRFVRVVDPIEQRALRAATYVPDVELEDDLGVEPHHTPTVGVRTPAGADPAT